MRTHVIYGLGEYNVGQKSNAIIALKRAKARPVCYHVLYCATHLRTPFQCLQLIRAPGDVGAPCLFLMWRQVVLLTVCTVET